MIIHQVEKKHINQIIRLFNAAYLNERNTVQSLPTVEEIETRIKENIYHLYENYPGIVVIEDNHVIGYLFYILSDELFGHSQGVFVPLTGHCSIQINKYEIYQLMLNHVSKAWIKKERLSWVVTLFEHDKVLEKFWFKNGFGQRCGDAILEVKESPVKNNDIVVKKAIQPTLYDIKDLHETHHKYYHFPPTCMPTDNDDAFGELSDWFNQANHNLWIAYDDQKAVGYMRVEENGESFISQSSSMLNVTSAFTDPKFRGHGIGQTLLSVIQNDLIKHSDIRRLGVDYETINPLAHRFWLKYFMPYTKSVARRIDERILD